MDHRTTLERHSEGRPPALPQVLLAIVLFGVSFGFVEAAVVVYLRALYEPIRQQFHSGISPADLFPLIRLEQLESAGPGVQHHLRIELAREAATLVMLAAVGLAVARNARQGLAAFLIAFGVWDIAFYASLKLLIDWPASLFTWDLLFLLPVPWAGPVIAPVLVAVSMIGAGVALLAREYAGRRLRLSWLEWGAVTAGGLTVVVAFCWDSRNITAGGRPNPFPWPLFALGEGIGLAGFLHAYRAGMRPPRDAVNGSA